MLVLSIVFSSLNMNANTFLINNSAISIIVNICKLNNGQMCDYSYYVAYYRLSYYHIIYFSIIDYVAVLQVEKMFLNTHININQ